MLQLTAPDSAGVTSSFFLSLLPFHEVDGALIQLPPASPSLQPAFLTPAPRSGHLLIFLC